ncbi:PXMP2/4 family protein 3 [Cladobotryum mycophilum]|uniref:PXMP2/4 family protein 3 n=1 Tax=Cladobotryum mycophilum TaxID=491253 RepID=A0ABR0S8Y5_9HYPO
MPSPIMAATLQAAALSTISNFCAQFINAHWIKGGIFHLDLLQLFRFVALPIITTPPNYLWLHFLERSFPAYPQVQHHDRGGKGIELKLMEEAARLGDDNASQSLIVASQSKFSLRNTLAKWFLDCISVGAFLNTAAFLMIMGVLKGQPGSQIMANIRTQTISIVVAGYKVWPIASIISFTLIPAHRRIVFLSYIGLGWGIYMSLVAARV